MIKSLIVLILVLNQMKVDVVLRPEDIDIVPLEQGKITGEVLSVLFKGVWNEAMVETVPGTTVKLI